VHLTQVSLLLFGQLGLVWKISSGFGPGFPLACGLYKFYANAGGKQQIQLQLLLVQQKQQENLPLSMKNYTTVHF
jgi:hypothetical protein